MVNKYILKYTNHFSHPLNFFKQKSESVIIEGDCIITNYNSDCTGKEKGLITIFFNDGKKTIKEGNGQSFSSNQEDADFSDKKFSIFSEVAKLAGDKETISIEDINDIDKLNKEKFGIQKIIKDVTNGVATIIWGENDILKIQMEKPLEYIKNIPDEYDSYIEQIAKDTGYSEKFIRHILSTEKFIPTAKDIGDGTTTIGFGHTTMAKHNNKFKKGDEIDLETAFAWLKQDLIDYEQAVIVNYNKCRNTPEYNELPEYNSLPQSLREAMIDVAYNRGPNKLADTEVYKSLYANLLVGESNYCYAAVRTRQEFKGEGKFTAGLMKRNVYRFLMSLEDFTPEEQAKAMRKFENSEQYYSKTVKMLKEHKLFQEAKMLERDWKAFKTNIEANLS